MKQKTLRERMGMITCDKCSWTGTEKDLYRHYYSETGYIGCCPECKSVHRIKAKI